MSTFRNFKFSRAGLLAVLCIAAAVAAPIVMQIDKLDGA